MTTDHIKLENTGLDHQNDVLVRMGKALKAFRLNEEHPYEQQQMGRILGTTGTALHKWEIAAPKLSQGYQSRSRVFGVLMEAMHAGEDVFERLMHELVSLQCALLVCETAEGVAHRVKKVLDRHKLPLVALWHTGTENLDTSIMPKGVTVVLVVKDRCDLRIYREVRELCRRTDTPVLVLPEDPTDAWHVIGRSVLCAAKHEGARSRTVKYGLDKDTTYQETALPQMDKAAQEDETARGVPNVPVRATPEAPAAWAAVPPGKTEPKETAPRTVYQGPGAFKPAQGKLLVQQHQEGPGKAPATTGATNASGARTPDALLVAVEAKMAKVEALMDEVDSDIIDLKAQISEKEHGIIALKAQISEKEAEQERLRKDHLFHKSYAQGYRDKSV